jgi:hypothetical protein
MVHHLQTRLELLRAMADEAAASVKLNGQLEVGWLQRLDLRMTAVHEAVKLCQASRP